MPTSQAGDDKLFLEQDRKKHHDTFIGDACNGESGDPFLERKVFQTMMECFHLWKQRHKKYGRGNIAQFGALGCMVRDADKTARLTEFYINKRGADAKDESVTDSWKDKVNYAVMGLLCERGEWPRT